MKRYLPFVIMAAVAVLTVGAGAMLYRAKQRTNAVGSVTAASPGRLGAEPLHVRGDPGAPVTLEEFGDFQCPSCATVTDVIGKLEQDYGRRLRVVFRHYPLAMHSHAIEAALAAEAAACKDASGKCTICFTKIRQSGATLRIPRLRDSFSVRMLALLAWMQSGSPKIPTAMKSKRASFGRDNRASRVA